MDGEKTSAKERDKAMMKLQKMPRDTSRIRVRNRCEVTGRPRGVYRTFRMSRISFRDLAHKGMIPGVRRKKIFRQFKLYHKQDISFS